MASLSARRYIRGFVLALFLLINSSFAFAGVDWQPVNPAELEMKDLPEQPGAPAFILYHEEIDNDHQHFHAVYMRVKVLTEAGRKYADVQIPYYRSDTTITDIHGRTIHPDGSIVEFQGKPFDKDYVKSKTIKLKMKTFSLPDVQVGSILEYRYTERYGDHMLWAPRWVLQEDLFQRKEHFSFTATSEDIMMPHGEIGHGLAYSWRLPKDVEVKNSHDRYDLDAANMAPYVDEEHMPPSLPYKYYVRFYYRAVANSGQFWNEEGKYWSKDVDRFVGKKGGVAETVNSIVAPGDSPEQKVKKIYAYTANIDNLSFHPQRTEQEQKVLGQRENRGAEDVLRQKIGDRDDITRLFVAMVRAAGIPAWVMAVTDRSETLFEHNYLAMDQLEAEIAIVQLNGKDVFLDPGTRFCPYGILNWKYSATKGIRQTPSGGTELAPTPLPDYMTALTKRVARFRLNDQGQVEGSMAVGFFGQEALQRRLQGLHTDDVGRTKILEDEAKSWLPAEAQISMTKPPDWNAQDAPLVVEYKVSSPMLISAGKRVLLPADIFVYERPPMFPHNERVHPVYFEYPSATADDVKITLPAGLEVENLPASVSTKLDYALYKADRTQDKNVITSTRNLAIANFVIGPADYKTIKGFYDKVKEYDDQQVLLKRAANAAH